MYTYTCFVTSVHSGTCPSYQLRQGLSPTIPLNSLLPSTFTCFLNSIKIGGRIEELLGQLIGVLRLTKIICPQLKSHDYCGLEPDILYVLTNGLLNGI